MVGVDSRSDNDENEAHVMKGSDAQQSSSTLREYVYISTLDVSDVRRERYAIIMFRYHILQISSHKITLH